MVINTSQFLQIKLQALLRTTALILVLQTSAILASEHCQNFFKSSVEAEAQGFIGVVWGKDVSPRLLNFTNHSVVYELGRGSSGGIVYRVVENGHPRILKVYYDKNSARIDAIRLQTLRSFLASSLSPTFKIPNSRLIYENIMELDNVEGTPLNEVLENKHTSASLKASLLRKYEEYLHQTVSALEAHFPQTQFRSDGFILLDTSTDVKRKFFLKTDNIIVTPDLELVLVDPY